MLTPIDLDVGDYAREVQLHLDWRACLAVFLTDIEEFHKGEEVYMSR